jgi:hypothetical protein
VPRTPRSYLIGKGARSKLKVVGMVRPLANGLRQLADGFFVRGYGIEIAHQFTAELALLQIHLSLWRLLNPAGLARRSERFLDGQTGATK